MPLLKKLREEVDKTRREVERKAGISRKPKIKRRRIKSPWLKIGETKLQLLPLPHGTMFAKPSARLRRAVSRLEIGENEALLFEAAGAGSLSIWFNSYGRRDFSRGVAIEKPYFNALSRFITKKYPTEVKMSRFVTRLVRFPILLLKHAKSVKGPLNLERESIKLMNLPGKQASKMSELWDAGMLTFRSYLMSRSIREYLKANPAKKARFFVGTSHGEEVKIFLTDAKTRQEYFEALPADWQALAQKIRKKNYWKNHKR